MFKVLAAVLLSSVLLACSNTPQCPTTTGYSQVNTPTTYQQPTQDDGFGVAEFVAGAAIGSLATNEVTKRRDVKPTKTLTSYKRPIKAKTIKKVSKRKASVSKPSNRKISLSKSSSRSGRR